VRDASWKNVTYGASLPQNKILPSDLPKVSDIRIDRVSELDRIELDIQVGQAGFGFKGDLLGSQNPLERGRGGIIVFDHLFDHLIFGDEFEDGLEALA